MYFLKGTSILAAYIQETGHKNLLKFQDASGKKLVCKINFLQNQKTNYPL